MYLEVINFIAKNFDFGKQNMAYEAQNQKARQMEIKDA